MRKLRLIGALLGVVLAGYLVGAGLNWLRLPGVDLDHAPEILTQASGAPAVGPERARVTVHVFADYRCGVCRLDHEAVAHAVATSPQVRFVFREWAILGPTSREAARLALAAARQGRYLAMRDALMRSRIDDARFRDAAHMAGVDWDRLQRDATRDRAAIDRELALVSHQARALGLPGTPAYLIGRRLVIGRIDARQFRRLIERAATSGG